MLQNRKIGHDWIFQIIIRYYNSIFLISVSNFFFFFFFWARDYRRMIFYKVHLYIWAVAGHELSSLSITAQSFNSWLILQFFLLILQILDDLFSSMIKQVHNSLTVHDNSWNLKFDNFSEFQNVISDNPPSPSVIATHWLQKSICDSPQNGSPIFNDDLSKIREWVFCGEMSLIPIPQNILKNSYSHAKRKSKILPLRWLGWFKISKCDILPFLTAEYSFKPWYVSVEQD